MTRDPDTEKVETLCHQIGSMLYGKGPEIQSAVLAELLSMWAAGFPDEKLRETMLEMHLRHVGELIPINSALLHGKPQ